MKTDRLRKFIIHEKAWNTMQQYASIAYNEDKNEVSGLIPYKKVEHPVSKESVYELFEPVILKQENTGTTTELDGDAIRDYTVKAGMKYGTDIKFCWWHSHHTMGAFWSSTDQNEIKAWENDSWSLALVVNLYQEYKLNVAVWNPIKHTEDVPLEIIRNVPNHTKKQLKEYEELCSNPVVATSSYGGWKNGNWINGNQTAMFKPKKDEDALTDETKLQWKTGESIEVYAELVNVLDESIDDMINDFIQGTIDYKQYSKLIDTLNKSLKVKNARMHVIKLPEGSVLEKAMTMQSWEHVEYQTEEVEKIYDTARTAHYNYGFGGDWV